MRHIKQSSRITTICALFLACSTICAAADGDKFKLVKNVSELKDGDKVIIVKKRTSENADVVPFSFALGKYHGTQKNTLMPGVEVSVLGDVVTVNDDVDVIELEQSSNKFYLKSSVGKYLCMYNNDNANSYFTYQNTKINAKNKLGLFEIGIIGENVDISYIVNSSVTKCMGASIQEQTIEGCRFGWYSSLKQGDTHRIQLYKQILDQVDISESADNTTVIHDNLNKTVDVDLTRTLVADKWNTFCVPFDIDCSDGTLCGTEAQIMEYSKVEGNVMFFTQAKTIEAGKPYLIKPTESVVNPLFANVVMKAEEPTAVGDKDNYQFCGTYSTKKFEGTESRTSLFVNGNAKFSRPKEGSEMKGMRAYFVCASEQLASSQLDINGESTDISSVVSDADKAGNIYNLNGVCVGKDIKGLAKGFYIKGGKKFSVK